MPKKTSTKETTASVPVRAAAKPRVTKPRVATVKHSKAASAPVAIVETETIIETEILSLSAHEQIAKIAYGYWEARGFEAGCPEQDWLRAEREFLNA